MGSFVSLRPLIDSRKGIFCHLLEMDSTRIVVDCGIGEDFDYSIYDPVAEVIGTCDCILLTSFDVSHMGAVGMFPTIPVYCSIPTAVLGRIVLEDYHSRLGNKVLPLFTPKQIKFSQPFRINDVEVSSFNAGYILGNSSFRITKDLHTVVVCYNLNHRREHFLDGFHSGSIEDLDVFVTNSSYARVSPCTIKARDERILRSINRCPGRVVISATYTRLLEIICILHGETILIVSMHGKQFVERAKAMIEWAGPKAGELLSTASVEFGRVSDIDSHRIVVVLNESHPFGYLGTILDRFNSPATTLFLLDCEDFYPEQLNVYDFTYTHKEPEVLEHQEDTQESEEVLDNAEVEHWSHTRRTVFLRGECCREYMFPRNRKRKQNSPYGEAVKFRFEKKVGGSALKDVMPESIEVIENASLVKTGIIPQFTIQFLSTLGISDSMSCRTIVESLDPRRVVITDDGDGCALYMSTSFSLSKVCIESLVCTRELSLGSGNVVAKATISEKIMDLEFKKLLDKRVSKFVADRRGSFVEMSGDYEKFTVGSVDKQSIKRSLIECGFKVESSDEALVINNSLTIVFEDSGLSIAAKDTGLLVSVREVLYRFVAII